MERSSGILKYLVSVVPIVAHIVADIVAYIFADIWQIERKIIQTRPGTWVYYNELSFVNSIVF